MKTSSHSLVLALFVGVLGASAACSMPPAEEASTAEAQLRELTADEIVGEIAYGDTKEVELTNSPTYRALSFQAARGDIIEARISSLDATDPVAWLTDDKFNTISVVNDTTVTDLAATIRRTLPKDGKYFLVFREMNRAPRAKFAVALKQTGSLPAECDPNGEGIVDPECTDPSGFDPFSAESCTGPELSAADAATKFGPGIALQPPTAPNSDSKIYYRVRQCGPNADGVLECSPWVRNFLMDILVGRVAAPPATPGVFLFTANTASRTKVKAEFAAGPASLQKFCVDGPFAPTLRNGDAWTKLDDNTGVCGFAVASPPVVTATCARFEPVTIQLNASATDDTQYTEYQAVLFARY
jgi:hypothetical protein